MAQLSFTQDQQAQLQAQVQRELERREWAEPDDNVMAEYITVLLSNGSTKERVSTEMDDLVGSDFDAIFLDWLFDTAKEITAPRQPSPSLGDDEASQSPTTSTSAPRSSGGGRLFSSAVGGLSQPEKRKADDRDGGDGGNKRRFGDPPSGPRSLADRMGPGPGVGSGAGSGRGGLHVRGMAGQKGRGNFGSGPAGPGFRPRMNGPPPGPGFGPGFFPPAQQEMMTQMMMMQASMAQMGQMMDQMNRERDAALRGTVRPARPLPAKIPHGTKLGSHSVSAVAPKRASSPGPIPDTPTSKALCRYGVACSNSRCPHSHPSPVADEKTGMVLSDEACQAGKDCKDPECVKSHVSPAAVHGDKAGPSRMLCKYQNCTNPSCAFRHEDAEGNPIPPPALTAQKAKATAVANDNGTHEATKVSRQPPSSDAGGSDDGDMEVVMTSKSLMDRPLEDEHKKTEKACRYGERCSRPDCSFSHPSGRSTPWNSRGGARGGRSGPPPSIARGGLSASKKFGAPTSKLDPSASAFKPTTA